MLVTMDLKSYLKLNNLSTTKFANAAGCAQSMVSMVCSGNRRPSPDLALAISRATGGQVSVLELLYPDMDLEPHPVINPEIDLQAAS